MTMLSEITGKVRYIVPTGKGGTWVGMEGKTKFIDLFLPYDPDFTQNAVLNKTLAWNDKQINDVKAMCLKSLVAREKGKQVEDMYAGSSQERLAFSSKHYGVKFYDTTEQVLYVWMADGQNDNETIDTLKKKAAAGYFVKIISK